MCLRAVGLGQMSLEVPALMNGTALMHQLLAEPGPEGFDQPTPTISHEENPSSERQAAMFETPKPRLANLVILRGVLPEPEGHLLPDTSTPKATTNASPPRWIVSRKRADSVTSFRDRSWNVFSFAAVSSTSFYEIAVGDTPTAWAALMTMSTYF